MWSAQRRLMPLGNTRSRLLNPGTFWDAKSCFFCPLCAFICHRREESTFAYSPVNKGLGEVLCDRHQVNNTRTHLHRQMSILHPASLVRIMFRHSQQPADTICRQEPYSLSTLTTLSSVVPVFAPGKRKASLPVERPCFAIAPNGSLPEGMRTACTWCSMVTHPSSRGEEVQHEESGPSTPERERPLTSEFSR